MHTTTSALLMAAVLGLTASPQVTHAASGDAAKATPSAKSKQAASAQAGRKAARSTTINKSTAVKKDTATPASQTPASAKPAATVSATTSANQSPVQAAPGIAMASAYPVASTTSANPYLRTVSSVSSDNPYLPNQPMNPYLAYKLTSPYQPAQASIPFLSALPFGSMPGARNAASGNRAASATGERKHFSLSPLPVDIYMNPGMRPAVAFTTPCVTVAKLTNNFPPIMAMESFMFDNIGRINESEALPFSIEPVCT